MAALWRVLRNWRSVWSLLALVGLFATLAACGPKVTTPTAPTVATAPQPAAPPDSIAGQIAQLHQVVQQTNAATAQTIAANASVTADVSKQVSNLSDTVKQANEQAARTATDSNNQAKELAARVADLASRVDRIALPPSPPPTPAPKPVAVAVTSPHTLRGSVISTDGKASVGAVVQVIGDKGAAAASPTLSGVDGSFSFSLPSGDYTVTASSGGASGSGKVSIIDADVSVLVTLGASSKPKPLGDYVPCLFDHDDEAYFRGEHYSGVQMQQQIDRFIKIGIVTDKAKLAAWLATVSGNNFESVIQKAYDAGGVFKSPPLSKDSTDDQKNQQRAEVRAVAGAFQQAVAPLTTAQSLDVGCSQSLIGPREAKAEYGNEISKQYLLFQVTVRNMNPDKEFLIHDVQIAIENHRFIGGRDKVIARGVALQGQVTDPRNVTIRALEALSGIGSVVVGLWVPNPVSVATHRVNNLQNGISLLTAGLLPGVRNLWPDRTIDQLNRFNDTSFASSNSYKILIPKSGSATFVTYVSRDVYPGYDPTKLTDLQDNSFVVVAGAHVLEEAPQASTVTSLTCPGATGPLDYSKAKDGVLSCDVKGTGLSFLKALKLRTNDSTLPTATGTLYVSGQSTSGRVDFQVADLEKLTATTLAVYGVNTKDVEIPTDLSIQIQPKIESVSPQAINLAQDCSGGNCVLTVKGHNLGVYSAIDLRQGTDMPVSAVWDANGDGLTRIAKVKLDPSKGANYNVWVTASGSAEDSKQVVTGFKIDKIDPSTQEWGADPCQSTGAGTCPFTLSGTNLKVLAKIAVAKDVTSASPVQATLASDFTTSGKGTFKYSDLSQLADGAYKVLWQPSGETAWHDSGLTVQVKKH